MGRTALQCELDEQRLGQLDLGSDVGYSYDAHAEER
jgi:hypothetical protein